MTVFSLSKWAMKKIDRIRRNFLWKGSEDAQGGHCLVNWRRVCRAKFLGGLGIKDLQKFNRALRLKWLWLQWRDPDRPWTGFKTQGTPAEMELFRACTSISIGDGHRANFWHDRWLARTAPKQMAPQCFKLARPKNLTVAQALARNLWMRGLRRMSTDQELRQYVSLWQCLQQVQLDERQDQITWRFTADGNYTVKSAYNVQFIGTFPDHDWETVWKSKVEPKCRFFCWLLLQRKILTSDKIIWRGGQADPICKLCTTETESPKHMVAECSFSQMVWSLLAQNFHLPILN